MINDLQKEIKKDKQIKKFCFYGFLKNLKFFEPYLLIFLMDKGITLFQIGILISIREIIINVFEIPSGFIADYFGRKKELYFCFCFYIVSFIFFFFTNSFAIAIIAMIFFGLGEAFRSGTHKAMIYTYLDNKGWEKEKTFVYGRTRSYSLIGSVFSSLIGILIILLVPSLNLVFLFSVIPYILDFILIITYPKYLDARDREAKINIKGMFKGFINNFAHNKTLRHILIEEGVFEGTISFIKDLIQPILESIIMVSGIVILASLSPDDNLHVILGIVYAVLNLIGSLASRKAYAIKGKKSNMTCLFIIHLSLAICMAILALVSKNPILVFIVYILIYILFNIRKPIYVDEIDDYIEKSVRATALSLSSQLKSLFLIIVAPLLGFIADKYGISVIMIILACLFIVSLPLLISKNKNKKTELTK